MLRWGPVHGTKVRGVKAQALTPLSPTLRFLPSWHRCPSYRGFSWSKHHFGQDRRLVHVKKEELPISCSFKNAEEVESGRFRPLAHCPEGRKLVNCYAPDIHGCAEEEASISRPDRATVGAGVIGAE